MSWKGIVIFAVVLVFLAGLGAVAYKITQTTEGYKTMGDSTYYNPTYNFAPLSFGCANFRAEAMRARKPVTNTTNTTNAIPKKTLLD